MTQFRPKPLPLGEAVPLPGSPPLVGYLSGPFDVFDRAHVRLIQTAAASCAHLIVGVDDDELVRAQTGMPPVMPLVERLLIVASVRGVDAAVPRTAHDEELTWQRLQYDLRLTGVEEADSLRRLFDGLVSAPDLLVLGLPLDGGRA